MAIHIFQHMPTVGAKARRHVFGVPALRVAIDGDAVVVVDAGELAELERPCDCAGFVGDALHHAAIAGEHPGAVVNGRQALAVELARQQRFREGHPHGIGEALAQRPGGRLDARAMAVFRVPGRLGAQLPETLEIVRGDVVARQVQRRVQQHGAVAVGQHHPIPVPPVRIARVVPQHLTPQHLRHVREAHGHAGMPAVGAFDRIHRERPDGVRTVPWGRHGRLEGVAKTPSIPKRAAGFR